MQKIYGALVALFLVNSALAAPPIIWGPGHATLLQNSLCLLDGVTCFSTGGGSGTVSSVSLTPPVGYSVSGSPVTTTGTLALALKPTQVISASAIDWSTGNVFSKSIGSTNTTFTWSNMTDGQTIIIEITSTSGNWTFPTTNVKWPSPGIPTHTSNGVDIITCTQIGSTNIRCAATQAFQ